MTKEKVETKGLGLSPPTLIIASQTCEMKLCSEGYPPGTNYGFMFLDTRPHVPVWEYFHPTIGGDGVTFYANANSRMEIGEVSGTGKVGMHNSTIDAPGTKLSITGDENVLINSSVKHGKRITLHDATLVRSQYILGNELNVTDSTSNDTLISGKSIWLTGAVLERVNIDYEGGETTRIVINGVIVNDVYIDNVSSIEISGVLRVADITHCGDGNEVQIFHRAHHGKFHSMCGDVQYIHSGNGDINIGPVQFTQLEMFGGFNPTSREEVPPAYRHDRFSRSKLLQALNENAAGPDGYEIELPQEQEDNLIGVYYQMLSRMRVFKLLNLI